MNEPSNYSLLAVDVGSSCVKLGWFPARWDCTTAKTSGELPIAAPLLSNPSETARIDHRGREAAAWLGEVEAWLAELPDIDRSRCILSSVHPAAAAKLAGSLQRRIWLRFDEVDRRQLGLEIRVTQPERVGVDRLLAALAINKLRSPNSAAIFVDMGTATTVNLVAGDGGFEGGAILAGPALALVALHDATASLPRLGIDSLNEAPPAVGKSTEAALASGAFWGAVGAVNELVRQFAESAGGDCELFITGGASTAMAPLVKLGSRPAKPVPHLVLAGLCLAAEPLVET